LVENRKSDFQALAGGTSLEINGVKSGTRAVVAIQRTIDECGSAAIAQSRLQLALRV
jgi:hypothetical protein